MLLPIAVQRSIQYAWTFASQLFPGKPGWTADHLPDLSTKVFVVTGGNTGIGRDTVKRLLLKNAKVYIAARSEERAARAIAELHEETCKVAFFLQVDLGDLTLVKKAAKEYKRRESQLNGLILNAGVLFPAADHLTAQEYDATIGINVVGHFFLHRLLHPLLSASGRESDPSRVVWLSSIANYNAYELSYAAYRDGPVRKSKAMIELYSESKVAAVMMSMRLARTCRDDHVVSIAVDPGHIKSEIYRSSPWYLRLFDFLYWYPVEYGALGSLFAGAAPEAAEYNGKYLRPWLRVEQPATLALNEQEQEKLWMWLEDQVQPYL